MIDGQPQDAIIQMFHVHKRFQKKPALVDITLDIHRNEFAFITGPSGAGKSTLLKLLYLGERVTQGHVLVNGMNLSRIPRRRIPELRRNFGIVFQDYKLIPTKTVFENVALVLEAAGEKGKWIRKKVHGVLRNVGIEKRAHSLPPSLSGGEQQRVAVARAMVGEPKILLADEPTGSLDAEAAGAVFALLVDYHAQGGTVLVATHDRELMRKTTARVIHLDRGRLQQAPPA